MCCFIFMMWNFLTLWKWHNGGCVCVCVCVCVCDRVKGGIDSTCEHHSTDYNFETFSYKSVTANQGKCRYEFSQKISVCMALGIHTVVFWDITPVSQSPSKILPKHTISISECDCMLNVEAVWSSDMVVHICKPLWCQPNLQHKLRNVPHNLQHGFQVGYVTHFHSKERRRDLPPLPNY